MSVHYGSYHDKNRKQSIEVLRLPKHEKHDFYSGKPQRLYHNACLYLILS